MLGALLTFFGASVADAIRHPTTASLRALCYILLTGGSAVLMSGWVEQVAQIEDKAWLLPAKVALGPLSGALALLYLGIWFDKIAQDAWLDRLIHWGSATQCLAAIVLLAGVSLYPGHGQAFLKAAFVVNGVSVILAFMSTARGVALGDRLASFMLLACACLGVMVVGLYSKGLGLASSKVLWALTALCTTTYFLITTVLTIRRNREMRMVRKMSEGVAKSDEITGLPVGGTLLSKIDDALWRSVRMERECAVMAIWVDNLYVFNDALDSSIEHEIRHVLTARIRRAIGFRHTLGLQQARCFVAGISAVQDRDRLIERMGALVLHLQRPLQVGVMLGQAQAYSPQVSIGLVFVGLGHMADTLSAMDQAQALAKKAMREESKIQFEEAHPTSYGVSSKFPVGQAQH